MNERLKAVFACANAEAEMDLKGLRATRVPSKIKRELRRKYARKHKRSEGI